MNEEKTAVRPSATVTLREITRDTLRDILRLKVTEVQDDFVAPNAVSIAEAYFEPKAWFRGIYADETAVGFAMLYVDEDEPVYYLWRYMIAAPYQKMSFGAQAMTLLIAHVRTNPNAKRFLLSYVPHPEGPRDFYAKLGFVDTGKVHDGENEMALEL
ncbi:MAG: GNAT family N-acetyltransferase [Chloroflexota bacterium]